MADMLERLKAALGDRYVVERELGRGGMAVVFLAEDLKHSRKVALKVLLQDRAENVGAERFLREIELAANLSHPHILPVFDSGDEGGFLYYAMPYVDGETLRDRLEREGQLSIQDAVLVAREVAGALEHAHDRGVIHRDIKPGNIMLEGGHARVADFGIALPADTSGERKLTAVGMAIGTPEYMSPEQGAGDLRIDGRSDIYSLGCVLYEMLAGEPPFTGPTAQAVLAKKAAQPLPRIQIYRETVPDGVDKALRTALAKSKVDRFATAADFAEALSNAGDRITPVGSADVEVSTREAQPSRKARPGFIVTALAALTIAVYAGWNLTSTDGRTDGLDPTRIAIAPFEVLGSNDPALLATGEDVAVFARNSIDGIGNLRASESSRAIGTWNGISEPTPAALGRELGAGLVVTGTITAAGADSVRLSVTVSDAAEGRPLANPKEWRVGSHRVDVMSDSVTTGVVDILRRTRGLGGSYDLRSIGSTSPAALRAFLQGERMMRAGRRDSARLAFEEAIQSDSTFALAHARLAWWYASIEDAAAIPYMLAAGALNRGLAPRESVLVAADSLWGSLGLDFAVIPRDDPRAATVNRLLGIMESAIEGDPDDLEVWVRRAETGVHLGWNVISEEDFVEAFERVAELDTTVMNDIHVITGFYLDSRTRRIWLDRYVEEARSRAAASGVDTLDLTARSFELASGLLDPAQRASIDLDSVHAHLRATIADPDEIRWFEGLVYDATDFTLDSDVAIDVALTMRPHVSFSLASYSMLSRGRLSAAKAVLDTATRRDTQVTLARELGLMGAIDREHSGRILETVLEAPIDATSVRQLASSLYERIGAIEYWAAAGDAASLREARDQLAAFAAYASGDESVAARFARYPGKRVSTSDFVDFAEAHLALVRGDTAVALEMLLDLPPSMLFGREAWDRHRLTAARLLIATGRDEEAADMLDTVWAVPFQSGPRAAAVEWRLERARVNEKLGRDLRAARAYAFVIAMWESADELLQPYVEEARAGLVRTTAAGG